MRTFRFGIEVESDLVDGPHKVFAVSTASKPRVSLSLLKDEETVFEAKVLEDKDGRFFDAYNLEQRDVYNVLNGHGLVLLSDVRSFLDTHCARYPGISELFEEFLLRQEP